MPTVVLNGVTLEISAEEAERLLKNKISKPTTLNMAGKLGQVKQFINQRNGDYISIFLEDDIIHLALPKANDVWTNILIETIQHFQKLWGEELRYIIWYKPEHVGLVL